MSEIDLMVDPGVSTVLVSASPKIVCNWSPGHLNAMCHRNSTASRSEFELPSAPTSSEFVVKGFARAARTSVSWGKLFFGFLDRPSTLANLAASGAVNGFGFGLCGDSDEYDNVAVMPQAFDFSDSTFYIGANNSTSGYLSLTNNDLFRFELTCTASASSVQIDGTVWQGGSVVSSGVRTTPSAPSWVSGTHPTWTHFVFGSHEQYQGTTGSPTATDAFITVDYLSYT